MKKVLAGLAVAAAVLALTAGTASAREHIVGTDVTSDTVGAAREHIA